MEFPVEELIKNEVYTNPKLSFDGERLAYINCNGGFKLTIRTLETSEEFVIHSSDNFIGKYFWTYDNNILLLQDNNGDEKYTLLYLNLLNNDIKVVGEFGEVNNIEILSYSIDNPKILVVAVTSSNSEFPDVYSLDLCTKEKELVRRNPGYVSDWFISESGKWFCGYISRSDGGIDLVLIDEKNDYKVLASWKVDEIFSSDFITFSKDESYIYIKDSSESNTSCFIKISLDNFTRENIFSDLYYDIDEVMINPKNKEIDALSVYGNKRIWKVINKEISDDYQFLNNLDLGELKICSRDIKDLLWIVSFNKDSTGITYYLFHRKSKTIELLFYGSPQLVNYDLAPMESIEFISRDGVKVLGYITLPKGIKDKIPLVVNVHGGPQSRDYFQYNKDVQWFVSKGYGCMQINYRGSIGFGKEFLRKGYKEWGGKMLDDIIDGVYFVLKNFNIDSSRICIYGGSYGGYAALAGATFNNEIFKCAISINGPSSLLTFLENMPPFWKKYKECFYERVGHPIYDRELLIEKSPLYNCSNIKCPIFIAQGERDPRVNKNESEMLVKELEGKKIKYEYLTFPNEGHSIRKNENKIKLYNRIAAFLEEYL